METRVAIYARVSTVMQADRYSLPMQKKDLVAYCQAILGTNDYVIYEDAGFSGKNTDRPAYQQMMSEVRKGGFSHVLVWKLDRISRNLLDFAQMYSELKHLGVVFISRSESFDTSSAMGEAMLKIILVFAELERNMTIERVTATMISRATAGTWNGSTVPYGYSYDKKSKEFSIDPRELEVCRLMLKEFKATKSIMETARRLNQSGYTTRKGAQWDPRGVKRILTSPFSYGCYVYNVTSKGREISNPESKWITTEGHHEPLFTAQDGEEVENIINSPDRRLHTQTSRERPFRRLIICGDCGAKMYPGGAKQYSGGYSPALYKCHMCIRSKRPYLGTMSDPKIGSFVIPVLSGLVRVQEDPSLAPDEKALERILLDSKVYKGASIDPNDLSSLFSHIGKWHESMSIGTPPEDDTENEKAALAESIRVEKRALERLQHLYLYDEASMSEQEYIRQRIEITSKISRLEASIASLSEGSEDSIEYMASHLLMKSYLLSKHPDYMSIVTTVSIPVLQEYLVYTLRSITVKDKKVVCITLHNGLEVKILYHGSTS